MRSSSEGVFFFDTSTCFHGVIVALQSLYRQTFWHRKSSFRKAAMFFFALLLNLKKHSFLVQSRTRVKPYNSISGTSG
jgi:hypothetical protein